MNSTLREHEVKGKNMLLACSALKQIYRDRLAKGISNIHWVYLKGESELIQGRMQARQGHYMKPNMLESQIATLEEPTDAITVDVDFSPEAIADVIVSKVIHD